MWGGVGGTEVLLLRAGRTDCATFTRRRSRSLAVSSSYRPLVSCFWQKKKSHPLDKVKVGLLLEGRGRGAGVGVKNKQTKRKPPS